MFQVPCSVSPFVPSQQRRSTWYIPPSNKEKIRQFLHSWFNRNTSISILQGTITYPIKNGILSRWFSELPKVGYVNPLEGISQVATPPAFFNVWCGVIWRFFRTNFAPPVVVIPRSFPFVKENIFRPVLLPTYYSQKLPGYNICQKHTLQDINISHLGKRKIIFKMPFLRDMLVPCRVVF